MDNYHDQTNWQYQVITRRLAEADLMDEDRQTIRAETQPRSSFQGQFPLCREIETIPRTKILDGNLATHALGCSSKIENETVDDYAIMFQSLRSEPFDIHAHSALVLNLLDSYPGDFLRVALERMSMEAELEPHFLVYSQFMARRESPISLGARRFQRSLKDGRRRSRNHADDVQK